MNFKEYQEKTQSTAVYPSCFVETSEHESTETRWLYPALGLSGEVGEVEEKLKKILRDKKGLISREDKELLQKELGDVLWYVAQLCETLGISMQNAAECNLIKLADRKARGVLQGSGDER